MCCTWYGRPPAQAVKGIHRLTGPLTNLPPRMIAGFCGTIRQQAPFPLPRASLFLTIFLSVSLSLGRSVNWLISSLEGLLTPRGALTLLVWQIDPHANGTDVSAETLSSTLKYSISSIKHPEVLWTLNLLGSTI